MPLKRKKKSFVLVNFVLPFVLVLTKIFYSRALQSSLPYFWRHVTNRNRGIFIGKEREGSWESGYIRHSMNVSLIECEKKLSRPIWACERIMDLSLTCVFRMVLVTLLFCSGIQKSGNVHRVTII